MNEQLLIQHEAIANPYPALCASFTVGTTTVVAILSRRINVRRLKEFQAQLGDKLDLKHPSAAKDVAMESSSETEQWT
ncbi:MAG: hypothetical protein ACLGQU_01840 [Acidobacteriota bacterium]